MAMNLTARFEQAFRYAADAHAGQKRKRTERPYLGHLLSVAALVLQYGGDEDEAIAALLHDAVEDSGGHARLDDIRARFGPRVAEIMAGCTDSFETDPQQKAPWLERKKRYVEHVRGADGSTRLVSAADKLSNVRETLADLRAEGPGVFARFQAGRDGTLWYYRAVTAALADGTADARVQHIVAELDRAVTELESAAGGK